MVILLSAMVFTVMGVSANSPIAAPAGSLNVYMPQISKANTNCSPLATLIYPADGAVITTLAPDLEFSYEANGSRTEMLIEVSTSPTFDAVVYSSTATDTGASTFTIRLTENLERNTQYYWRVTFYCANGGIGDTTAVFTTPDIAAPVAPTLETPQNGAVLNYKVGAFFGFTDVPNASYYRIFFYDPTIPQTCVQLANDSGSYINPSEGSCISANVTYQWYARAWTVTGWSEDSESRSVTFTQ